MKTDKIAIPYRSNYYFLDRTHSDYFPLLFETDRWRIHISILLDGTFRIMINKSVKKSETEYHTQFCYDCYCTLEKDSLYLNQVSDPATCKRIRNATRWFTIEPILTAIYAQLKNELHTMHPFDLIGDLKGLERFIHYKKEKYGTTEYVVNNSLRFGIGENAYTTSQEALKAKEKEPLALLNLFNGNHIISKDTVVFFLYWLLERDKKFTISNGEQTKEILHVHNR